MENQHQQGEAASYLGGGQQTQQFGQPPQGQFGAPQPQQVANIAQQHAGTDNDDDRSLFSNVLTNVLGSSFGGLGQNEEEKMNEAHQKIYGQQNGQPSSNDSSETIGAAAALQAFKLFGNQQSSGDKSGNNQLVGLALGEAMKLFNAQSQTGGGGADKNNLLMTAASMAMKLFISKQGGAGGSGGAGAMAQALLGNFLGGQQQSQQQQQQQQQQQNQNNPVGNLLGKFF
ncbi:uncharacterized protein VTP21DRAFT_5069 [Calcarisporiella thermophila]|uniref:uncharacterized protein n=1 Tax=Calcarisporiella thermophila TaxID=911321 RepID=UPI00374475AC